MHEFMHEQYTILYDYTKNVGVFHKNFSCQENPKKLLLSILLKMTWTCLTSRREKQNMVAMEMECFYEFVTCSCDQGGREGGVKRGRGVQCWNFNCPLMLAI